MAGIDKGFKEVVEKILVKGREYEDISRGCNRIEIPSFTLRHDFKNGFPAITLKKLAWKQIVGELLWFLRGDANIKYLVDNGIYIWNDDAYNWYKKACKEDGLYTLSLDDFIDAIQKGHTMRSLESVHGGLAKHYVLGDVGKNYSKQWRSFSGQVDQIVELIRGMKTNIKSTRLKVEAWNPAEVKKTALPPCHTGFQVIGILLTKQEMIDISGYSEDEWSEIVAQDLVLEAFDHLTGYGFELHWNQRSVDTFLGLPFNMGSYATLAKLLEKITSHIALGIEGNLKCVHLYDNSLDEANVLLSRDVEKYGNCDIEINMPDNFENLSFDAIIHSMKISDFQLVDYDSYSGLRVPMIAPKEV